MYGENDWKHSCRALPYNTCESMAFLIAFSPDFIAREISGNHLVWITDIPIRGPSKALRNRGGSE